jgi:hypothetical protein
LENHMIAITMKPPYVYDGGCAGSSGMRLSSSGYDYYYVSVDTRVAMEPGKDSTKEVGVTGNKSGEGCSAAGQSESSTVEESAGKEGDGKTEAVAAEAGSNEA